MKKLICLCFAVLLLVGCGKKETPVNGSAPDFTVQDAAGEEVKLSEKFGKPIVVNLWASWCPPCKAELPHFDQACKEYPDVEFMMVNLAVSDTVEDAAQVLSDGGYTFPVYYDTTGSAAIAYAARSIPVTIFISAAGDVVAHKVGMLSPEELEENIHIIRK